MADVEIAMDLEAAKSLILIPPKFIYNTILCIEACLCSTIFKDYFIAFFFSLLYYLVIIRKIEER